MASSPKVFKKKLSDLLVMRIHDKTNFVTKKKKFRHQIMGDEKEDFW